MSLTTVGYSIAPQTFIGQIVAGFCSLCGVFILKLPIPIIVNSFSALYDNRKWRTEVEEKKKEYILNQAAKERRQQKKNLVMVRLIKKL